MKDLGYSKILWHFINNYGRWHEKLKDEMEKYNILSCSAEEGKFYLCQHITLDEKNECFVYYFFDIDKGIETKISHHKKYQRYGKKDNQIKIDHDVLIKGIEQIHKTLCFLEKELDKIKEE